MMLLYDPNRINVPLRRTNPEMEVGVDPMWKEITNDVWTMVTVPGIFNFTDRDDVYKATGMEVKPEMAISCTNNWIATLANAKEQVNDLMKRRLI